jgi:hypothetical protein
MLMEAMRLSLLDHEEQQRKEAEERKKREAAAAATLVAASAGGESSAGSSPGDTSSTTEAAPDASSHEMQSSLPTSSSSSLSTLPPSHGNSPRPSSGHRSNDALAPGRRSWSISRRRTPPPPPSNLVPNLPVSEENQTAWRNRTEGPRPFSTLSAALTATSTAAAVLGRVDRSSSSRSLTPEPDSSGVCDSTVSHNLPRSPRSLQGKPDEGRPNTNAEDASVPTITIHTEPSQSNHPGQSLKHAAGRKIALTSTNQPPTSFSNSTTSSVLSGNYSGNSAGVPNGSYEVSDSPPNSTASARLHDTSVSTTQHVEQISS